MLPHIDKASKVVALEAFAPGFMGGGDQLFQHLALGQAVAVADPGQSMCAVMGTTLFWSHYQKRGMTLFKK
ncbi:hypothetical protein [Serratia fonticola]|uniref:Uncharacterized protein n=1 Tax=Serratia fonticola TaxID=47917 RepID=A0AAW3WSA4_SERFO|nr:hypothetical protein [Serratia fonticola]MBC3212507.1 hypothetical protein [Serratia fonticola]NYA13860.1 hypothetical protein [Serratia fonticola]NYA33680.1 hypothetical protein [Serratia fonticola]